MPRALAALTGSMQVGHTGMTGTRTDGACVIISLSILIIFKVENTLILEKAKHNYIM
jgi:hypothetical protein